MEYGRVYFLKYPFFYDLYREPVIKRESGWFMKKLLYSALLCIGMLSSSQIISKGNCPYTLIDCQKCCKMGRFVTSECCYACNNCCMYNDESCAECKDYPT